MKTTINKEFFGYWEDENVVMWCEKEEYAEEFCKLMHEQGLEWLNEKSYLDDTKWRYYGENIVYDFNEGVCDNRVEYEEIGYGILDFEDYIIHEEETHNTSNIQKHLELCNEIHDTYKFKNEKYGDSFNDTIKKYGMISALTRMSDKFSRIENNIVNKVDDNEKLEDNLLDLANYCLMTVMSLDKDNYYNVDGQGD